MSDHVLDVENLSAHFGPAEKPVRAVDDVSFTVEGGEILGIVGESGSGKSTTLRAVMGMMPGNGRVVDGAVRFDGRDLTTLEDDALREIRGNRIGLVFQEPIAHLNPAYTVGDQITDVLASHTDLDADQRQDRAIELLGDMGIPAPEERVHAYPHEFSGGMAQRVAIAMALACEPDLLLADEPTSALDVTIQAQIIDLLLDLQAEMDLSVVWVTHNMGIIAEVCDRMGVMYAGTLVEYGGVDEVFEDPKHPYTNALLETIPRHDRSVEAPRFRTIEGTPPDLSDLPKGCVFQDRCHEAMPECEEVRPPYYRFESDAGARRHAKCHLHPDRPRMPPSISAPELPDLDLQEDGDAEPSLPSTDPADGGDAA